jgi:hypothetical protein
MREQWPLKSSEVHDARLQPFLDQADQARVVDPARPTALLTPHRS